MDFGKITKFMTGVAIPVSSLRTEDSVGVGEFLDLIKFGVWCKKAGLDVVQILPVNDTGDDSSPYNALSAFALHPIYIRLQEIQGWQEFKDEITLEKSTLENQSRVDYMKVKAFKESVLKRIFKSNKNTIKSDREVAVWLKANPWAKTYCVYKALKEANYRRSWTQWEELSDPKVADIDKYWDDNPDEVLFHAWTQYILEKQLKQASKGLEELGLRLKGDIPILINEDSAEVWGHREYFDLTMRAGAPPDMFSDDGQNWGFPCFNWDVLEKEDYSWWRNRLRQAAKFYHAYRIDHVLGFFRIWQIDEKEVAGTLGVFNPANNLTKEEIKKNVALDDSAVDLLAGKLYTESLIRQFFAQDADHVLGRCFTNVKYDLFKLQDHIKGEKDILALEESDHIKGILLALYRNCTLVEVTKDNYQPAWLWKRSHFYNSLPDGQKQRLQEMFGSLEHSQDAIWRKTGTTLLKMMCETTDMLVCAEDLGAIPPCVPDVLNDLNILGLRVERWFRDWHLDGQPFVDTRHYPRLTVCSPAVHDTSTLRGWWEEPNWDKNQYYGILGLPGGPQHYLTTEIGAAVIRRNLAANSLLTIFLMQDLLGLYYNLRTTFPNEERINVPGTVGPHNWTYRMKDSVERLIEYDEYNQYVNGMIIERASRPL